MKRIIILLMTGLCQIHGSVAQRNDFKVENVFPIEAEHSYIGFSIRYMGYAMVRGRFTGFKGSVLFDEKDLAKTSVSLAIEINSINTGNEGRDNDLRSENWFNAKAFPYAYFISQKTRATPAGLDMTGDFTLGGKTKTILIQLTQPVPRVVKDVRGDSQIIFTGSIILNRRDFGIEGKNWDGIKEGITAVSDEVNIELTILAKRINKENFKWWVNDPASPQGSIYRTIKSKGVGEGVKEFEGMFSKPSHQLNEEVLNTVAYMLLKENQVSDALVLFRKNVDAFPGAPQVYDAYGEGLATSGNWQEALRYYRVALEKDPTNMNASEILRHLN